MIRRAALAACLLPAVLVGCTDRDEPAPDRDTLYRDQYVFVGDDGTVMPLTLVRRGDGEAEAKGWLARAERWENVYYQQARLPLESVPRVGAAADALSRADGTRARLDFDRTEGEVALTVRRPSSVVHLGARPVERLGSASDPEGPSVYSAGRATLRAEGERENGWLLVEETPADWPKRSFVDYGDYLLLFAVANGDTPVILRRSIGREGFDNAFVGDDPPRHSDRFEVTRDGEHLSISLRELGLTAAGRVSDRSVSDGVAPSGDAVTYEVLLVRGALTGVAFTIRDADAPEGDDT